MAETLTPMQQQLLDRADAIFASIGTAVGKATDFAAEQIPDIAVQFIAYNRIYLTSIIVIALLVLLVQQIVVIKWAKKGIAKDDYNGDGYIFAYFASTLITGGFTLVPVFANFKDLILVWFAPKIFLIEQMVHLVKSVH